MSFENWYTKLTEDSLWYELLRAYKDETIMKAGRKVYADLVADGTVHARPMSENRKHVYNILCKNPGDKVNKPWYKIEEQKKEAEKAKEWVAASPENVDKYVKEIQTIIKNSPMVNATPRIGHKQAVEEGGWLPPKPKPYPMTTEEEAYVRQRHLEYIKANYEPRTGAKVSGWITEDDFNLLYPDIKTMNFLTKAKEILSPRDLKLINPEDLEESYRGIQKRLRLYRDEIQYSNDKDFVRAKERRIEMLKVISAELRMLIEGLKPESKEL